MSQRPGGESPPNHTGDRPEARQEASHEPASIVSSDVDGRSLKSPSTSAPRGPVNADTATPREVVDREHALPAPEEIPWIPTQAAGAPGETRRADSDQRASKDIDANTLDERLTTDPSGVDSTSQSAGTTGRSSRVQPTPDGEPKAKSGVLGFLKETALILIVALVLSVLLKTFLVQAFYIPSESMQNTLQVGDRLLVNKLKPGPFDLERGDVVVFVDPGGWLRSQTNELTAIQKALTWVGLLPQNANEHLIKRMIGLPGDEVVCCDELGRITVNGEPIDEPYIVPGEEPSLKEFDVKVPESHLWLMGDNRPRSQDSRYSEGAVGGGFVPVRNVVGSAWIIIWPLNHATIIKNPSETFAAVPDPS